MGKSTINGHFQQQTVSLPEGKFLLGTWPGRDQTRHFALTPRTSVVKAPAGARTGVSPRFKRTSCRANVLSYSMFLSLKIHICSYIQYVHIYIYINGYVFLLSLSLSLRVGFPEIKSGSHQCVRCQKDAQMSRFCGWITCWRLNTSNGCVIYIYFNMFQLYSTHP